MGSEQSLLKAVASAKKRQDTTLVFRGDAIDIKWIPEEDVQSLKLEVVKLIDMHFVIAPPVLFQILSIKQLDLSSNNLVSITGIGALANLTDLDLSGNVLDFLPDDLGNCKNLSFLNVSQNNLTLRSIPPVFYDGRTFASIDISENKFGKMTPELISLLAATESISIHSNPWDIVELRSLLPTSPEEHVKTLLKLLKSTVLASGMSAATSSLPQKQAVAAAPKTVAPSSIVETEPSAERPSVVKNRDSFAKRISETIGKQSKQHPGPPSAPDNDNEVQAKRDSEVREPAKDKSAPPAIPPPRVDIASTPKAGLSAPPVVSKSPAAVAPPSLSRTQSALKTPSRPAGPKGRRLPSAEFIENNAQEEEVVILAKDGKTEIPVGTLSSGLAQADGPPPNIPSKITRPGFAAVSREPSVNRDSRPTLTRDVSLPEVEEQEDDGGSTLAKMFSPPTGKKPPPGGVSMLLGSAALALPSPKIEDEEGSSEKLNFIGRHKAQASEVPSVMKRQNTLTEQAKEDDGPSSDSPADPSKKVSTSGKKPPIGGISMFGGALNRDDASKKPNDVSFKKISGNESVSQVKDVSPEVAPPAVAPPAAVPPTVPVKKLDTVAKEPSLPNVLSSAKPIEKPTLNSPLSQSSLSPKKADAPSIPTTPTSSAAPPPPTIGKKPPPVRGASIFGTTPPISSESAKIEVVQKEDPALTAPAQTNPPQKELVGKKMFSLFGGQSGTNSSSDSNKDSSPLSAPPIVKKQEIPVTPPKEQQSATAPPPSKKPPIGGVSMFGGPSVTTDSFKEGNETGGNSGTLKKPPPGAVSMFGGAGMPIPRKDSSSTPAGPISSNDDASSSELRERLKQQLNSNQDSSSGSSPAPAPPVKAKPAPSTLPRSFKPSDMEASDRPALPSKMSTTSKSSDKLSGK